MFWNRDSPWPQEVRDENCGLLVFWSLAIGFRCLAIRDEGFVIRD
jgi:hypothetical protein